MSIALAILATFSIPAAILLGFFLWDSFEKLFRNDRTTEAHDDAPGDVPNLPSLTHDGGFKP